MKYEVANEFIKKRESFNNIWNLSLDIIYKTLYIHFYVSIVIETYLEVQKSYFLPFHFSTEKLISGLQATQFAPTQ